MRPITADLFAPAETMPAGFDYRPDIIDRAEEAALVAEFASLARFANCPAEDFEQALVSEYTPGTLSGGIWIERTTTPLLVYHFSRRRRCVCEDARAVVGSARRRFSSRDQPTSCLEQREPSGSTASLL